MSRALGQRTRSNITCGHPLVSAELTTCDGSQLFASSYRDHQRLSIMDTNPPIVPTVPNPWLSFHPGMDVASPKPPFSPRSPKAAEVATQWQYCMDPATQQPFWVNHHTKKIVLEPPAICAGRKPYTCSNDGNMIEQIQRPMLCSPFLSNDSTKDIQSSVSGKNGGLVALQVGSPPSIFETEQAMLVSKLECFASADTLSSRVKPSDAEDLSRAATTPASMSASNGTTPPNTEDSSLISNLVPPSNKVKLGGARTDEASGSIEHEGVPLWGNAIVQPTAERIRVDRSIHSSTSESAPGLEHESVIEQEHDSNAGKISTLKVYVSNGQSRDAFRVKTSTPLYKVFVKYCSKKEIDIDTSSFTYGNRLLSGSETAEALQMTDLNLIMCTSLFTRVIRDVLVGAQIIPDLQALSEEDVEEETLTRLKAVSSDEDKKEESEAVSGLQD